MSDEDLGSVLAAVAEGAASHLVSEPVSEDELRAFEARLGRPLPPSLRAFLAQAGYGIFFGGHEVFGPSCLLVHDIEMVPSMLGLRRSLGLAEDLLPFHRHGGVLAAVSLSTGAVVEVGGGVAAPSPAVWLRRNIAS